MSQLAKELELVRREYLAIIDGISDAIVFADRLGNIAFMNKAFKRKYNNGTEVIQVPIQRIFSNLNYNFDGKLEQYWKREGFFREKNVELQGILVEKDKVCIGYWVIVRDKEVKAVDAKGMDSHRLLPVEIIDNLADPVAILDYDDVFVYGNKSFIQLLGIKKKELLGKNSSFFIKGLENCQFGYKGEMKVEVSSPENGTEVMDLLVYPIKIGNRENKMLIIKATELYRTLQYKVRLLSSKVAYYQEQFEQITEAKYKLDKIIGKSEQITALKESIKKMSCSNCTVLLRGEEGTGKELFARVMHGEGPRKFSPFVKIRCADLNKPTKEKEWARQLALANKGTIYFDEITDLSSVQQRNLFNFITTKSIDLDDGQPQKLDVRIIVSTKNNIEQLVQKRLFSERLYYRLAVLSFRIPPLRDRREDLLLLAEYFIKRYKEQMCIEQGDFTLSKEFINILSNHQWPGNIKELKGVIETALSTADGPVLTLDTLPEYLKKLFNKKDPYSNNQKLKEILEETEKMVLIQTLKKTAGNKVKAAKLLGISRAGLYQKLEKHSLLDE